MRPRTGSRIASALNHRVLRSVATKALPLPCCSYSARSGLCLGFGSLIQLFVYVIVYLLTLNQIRWDRDFNYSNQSNYAINAVLIYLTSLSINMAIIMSVQYDKYMRGYRINPCVFNTLRYCCCVKTYHWIHRVSDSN